MARRPGDIRLLYHHFEQSEKSLSFAVRNSRFPHMCHALLRFPHLSFIPPVPYPPLRGTFPMRGRLCIGDSDTLVYDALETIFSLSFIPLVPYPARFARHLPHAGKALSVVILFPHMRVFVLTIREYHLLKKRRSRHLNPEPNESKIKRGCEEMRIHFFTALFFIFEETTIFPSLKHTI